MCNSFWDNFIRQPTVILINNLYNASPLGRISLKTKNKSTNATHPSIFLHFNIIFL